MATTPEGKVKEALKAALKTNNIVPFVDVVKGTTSDYEGFYYMPVAGPFAVLGVHDFVGCWKGVFFSLETKAPNEPKDETYHQGRFREAVTKSGGVAMTGVRDAQAAVSRLRELVEAPGG